MTEIHEYQVIRPDGTVLLSMLAPAHAGIQWGAEAPGFEIRGEMITRWRVVPDGQWIETARYSDGWASWPVIIRPKGAKR